MLSAKDIREFRGFLRNATDRQVQGIYEKEQRAGRDDYAELAVAEAERRGIVLDDDRPSRYHSTKKTRAQLDREIAAALGGTSRSSRSASSHATVGGTRSLMDVIGPGDRVTIVDRFGKQRTGRAVMHGPHGWVLNMGGTHGTPAIATDENTVSVKYGGRKTTGHATKKSGIPGIAKWSTSAGGTGAAAGKHGYSYRTGIKGEYHIWPYTTKYGRHAGYALKYAATGGQPRGSHGGLWHELGTFSSPAGAAKAARDHYQRSFE